MGLFDGLFRRGKQADAPPSKDFFLDPDEAKTYSNIEYMRTPRVVKKTFPATGGAKEEVEVVELVSSIERVNPEAENKGKLEPSVNDIMTPPAEEQERRRSDPSLDFFRSMAKDLGRG
ncbi:MAG TPA: hypothetical protein IGQ16_02160 [Thermosynechococcus sp. M3746_W2019_013]|uniref:hypothetical protein n=1 Tax=Thermosynechococcus sp. M3746_W2019_013 TaxID=2747806 RepID=UPI001A0244E3|nr:hypothetical protein [Thermosynechococcus sp. M3746_W2019_013]HIK22461.1 hypothetical protein [Thermosynechococcus sp. M3746_W2019_013]